MHKFDYKHIAFHVLVALFFIWFAVFSVLLGLSLTNALTNSYNGINNIMLPLILLNVLMGTTLFVVIKLFRNRGVLNKVIAWCYGCIAAISVVAVIIIKSR